MNINNILLKNSLRMGYRYLPFPAVFGNIENVVMRKRITVQFLKGFCHLVMLKASLCVG